jgi:hypothetical protein
MAGQMADAFWRQTPASFDAVMRGVIAARKAQGESDMALAYQVAAFNAAGRAGKLKSLSHYQSKASRKVAQTPAEMLEVFRQFKARGVPMNIRRIERTPS